MNLRERVGLNLKKIRHARGLSQEALSFEAGLDRGYIGMIENAKYSLSMDTLEKIAVALDVDPDEIVARRS